MKAGRKSQPTKLKILKGERNKDRINKHEPKPRRDMPSPPAWLDTYAKQVWKYYAKDLNDIGVLTIVDRDTFAAYCQAVSTARKAQLDIDKNGLTIESSQGIKANPTVNILNKALEIMRHYANEFGLTPSARAGLNVDIPKPKPEKEDGKLHLLGRRK